MKAVPRLSPTQRIRPAFRVVVVVLLGVFAVVGGIRAYCPMPVAATASANAADPHRCCRSGFAADVPSCCHADEAPALAMRVAKAAASLPALGRADLPRDLVSPEGAAPASPPAPRATHESPPTVLRV